MLEMEKMGKLACLSYKPHFFQPILPGSSSADVLPIPKAFQRDYLVNGEDGEGVATLKSPLKSWKVKLNEFKFTDGWADFFKTHELSMGNFLVFEYEGDLIFQVWVFDTSYCEVEYSTPPLMSDENEMHHGDQMGAEGVNRESKGKGKKRETFADNVKESHDDDDDDDDDDELEEANEGGTSICISKYPYFTATLKSYNIGRSYLAIPSKFSKLNIPDDVAVVILKDAEGERWPINITRRKDSRGVIFGCGWFDFQSEKGLKTRDICLFEQEDEDEMVFKVSIIT